MIRLTKTQIIALHRDMIAATGGTEGIRNESLLDSAVNIPFQTFDGYDLYPSVFQKAARLGYSLINNHPFVDGNKRTGLHSMLVFLSLNGIEICCSQTELVKTGLSLADGNMSYDELVKWLTSHS